MLRSVLFDFNAKTKFKTHCSKQNIYNKTRNYRENIKLIVPLNVIYKHLFSSPFQILVRHGIKIQTAENNDIGKHKTESEDMRQEVWEHITILLGDSSVHF